MKWKYLLAFGISAFFLALIFSQADLVKVFGILKNASLPLVLACVFLEVINLSFKVTRWKLFLDAYKLKIRRLDLASTYLASLFLGNIIPARIGEVTRPYFLKKRYKTSFFKLLPVVLVERFLDMGTLLVSSMIFLLFFSFFVSTVFQIILMLAFLIILTLMMIMLKKSWMKRAISAILSLLKMKKQLRKIDTFVDNFYIGLRQLKRMKIFPTLCLTILSFLCEVFTLYLSSLALGLNMGVGIAFGFLSLSLFAGTISSLPGGLGSTEAVLFALLLLMSVSPALAVSIAVLSRFLSYGLSVVFSFPFFLREMK